MCLERGSRHSEHYKTYYCLLSIKLQVILIQAERIRSSKIWGKFVRREGRNFEKFSKPIEATADE